MNNSQIAKRSNNYKSQPEKLYITAIVAFLEGMEAIHVLFNNMPHGRVAYVIIQHISTDNKIFIAELLEKHSNLQISIAKNGMLLEPNQVYVMPRDKNMIIKDRLLFLTDSNVSQTNYPVDIFLDSLARAKGAKSIAVIISRIGNEAVKGIAAIKKAGGMVIFQDPESAECETMANNAINLENSEISIASEFIPKEIVAYINRDQLESNINNEIAKDDADKLFKILQLIQIHTPLDFTEYKRPTIIRKIAIRMTRNKIKTLEEYIAFLMDNHTEIKTLAQEFLVSVTKFFRDKEAFEVMGKIVIPKILESKLQMDTLKVWVIGCATGEEAYSLAILIREVLDSLEKDITVKIFASDIDKLALLRAFNGIYNASIEENVSKERLNKFFIKQDNNYKVKDEIRKMIVFANHDIIRQPPYLKIDLISCRNMLIYVNPILQRQILTSLHFCLNLGGYLFLGPSESLGTLYKSFVEVDEKWNIYKSIEVALNLSNTTYVTPGMETQRTYATPKRMAEDSIAKSELSEIVHQTLIEESGFTAGICVDNMLKIVHTFGNYDLFLLPKIFNFDLLEMLPNELSLAISTSLTKALLRRKKIALRKITFNKNDFSYTVDILVKPFFHESTASEYKLVILFRETEQNNLPQIKGEVFDIQKQTLQQIVDLKYDLGFAKQELKETYEALDESNKNLASYNEEIISFNEEMQSSNEELQSVNEEHQTVNEEYQSKIKELADLNDDLDNYFKSSIHGQLYVDKNLILKKFTPSAVKQINFKDSDIGRLLSDISTNIKFSNLIDDIKTVIITSRKKEKEVQNQDGKWYQMVIMPYIKNGDLKNNGAIITFNDITQLKLFQDKLSRRNADHKTFIYTASHDLKVPVANMKMLITMLKEIIDPENIEVNELMDMIDVSAMNFIDTIAELSDIAKIESEMYEYEIVDVKDLVQEIRKSMSELLTTSKTQISLDLKAPIILFSKKNLRSILYNLLNNAVKYRSPYRTPEIMISTEKIEDTFVMRVQDNGLGIESSQIDKIFEKFERTHFHVEGSGIGLYLVKRMIENSGGYIKVESILGEGTVFELYFKPKLEN